MTPLAHKIAKYLISHKPPESIRENRQLLERSLDGARFMEVSGIEDAAREVMFTIAGTGKDPDSAAEFATQSTAHLTYESRCSC